MLSADSKESHMDSIEEIKVQDEAYQLETVIAILLEPQGVEEAANKAKHGGGDPEFALGLARRLISIAVYEKYESSLRQRAAIAACTIITGHDLRVIGAEVTR
jgi:hypothetical protein